MSTTNVTTQPAPPPTDRASKLGEPPRRRARVHAWMASALRDLVYAGAVFVWSIAAFTILVIGVSVTASLLVFVVGVIVWVGFVYVVRWTTWVDRRLAGWQRHERLHADYRRPPASGFLSLLRTVSSDPQTWRDVAWLGVTSIAGLTLGLAAVIAVGIGVAYVSADLVPGDPRSSRPVRADQPRPVHRRHARRGPGHDGGRPRARSRRAAARAWLRDRARGARRANPESGAEARATAR